MAFFYPDVSHTFNEYLLVPNLTEKHHIPENVRLNTPLVKYRKGEETCPIVLNTPIVSAVMQAVSDHQLAIALARCGGLSFIYGSQTVAEQAEMVRKVKSFKAGYVVSDSNLKPQQTLRDVVAVKEHTGHSTIAITDDGSPTGLLLGLVTSRDYRVSKDAPDKPISEFMTPFEHLICGRAGISLSEANVIIWDNKLNQLPIIDENNHLVYIVFRKDYDEHKQNPLELLDGHKRLMVGAGINTRDYSKRVPALLEAGVDVMVVDSSDGYAEWQGECIRYIRKTFGDSAKVGGGNVVDREGFLYLVEAGADFVKVGIGGGSICITREQKGIGRGQASSVIEVAAARDEYFEKTGIYVPICSDGGIVLDYHLTLALAMGADFCMMGRYFARFDESPSKLVRIGNTTMKEYWGEGSNRARNWQRYDMGGVSSHMKFEEGVDSYVPYAGKLKDNLDITLEKIKSTMCSCGSVSIEELQRKARLALVSATSITEGGAHDVVLREGDLRSV